MSFSNLSEDQVLFDLYALDEWLISLFFFLYFLAHSELAVYCIVNGYAIVESIGEDSTLHNGKFATKIKKQYCFHKNVLT